MDRDRVSIENAIEFVGSVQSYAFGQLLAAGNYQAEHPDDPSADRTLENEREVQKNLERASARLRKLQSDGQQTISRRKVFALIEEETGLEFVLTE